MIILNSITTKEETTLPPPTEDHQAKWIHFKWDPHPKIKTWVYNVLTKHCDPHEEILLGEIKWYAPWRKYCFFPVYNTVYEHDCLQEVINFLSFLKVDHMKQKLKEKSTDRLELYKLRMNEVDNLVSQNLYTEAFWLLKQPL